MPLICLQKLYVYFILSRKFPDTHITGDDDMPISRFRAHSIIHVIREQKVLVAFQMTSFQLEVRACMTPASFRLPLLADASMPRR